ncbi:MAG: FAD-dependent oxidoreductase, partial [Terrimesophilobacter sp.]
MNTTPARSDEHIDPVFDVAVIGAGIVGLAVGRELLLRRPELTVAVFETEQSVATHQSGHNSGVIHSGIYYTPGSLKARLCVEGSRLMYEYCDAHDIRYERCGKLIVATSPAELGPLHDLEVRGQANKVP